MTLRARLTRLDRGLTVLVLVGAALSFGGFFSERAVVRERRLAEYEQLGSSHAAAVVQEAEGAVASVRAAANYLATSQVLEQQDYGSLRPGFRLFGAELTTGSPDLYAVAWVPRVAGPDRETFLERARPADGTPFGLNELGPDGALVPAAERPAYFPVAIVGPIPPLPMRGTDLGTDPGLRARLDEAIRSGAVVAEMADGRLPVTRPGQTLMILVPLALRPTVTETTAQRVGFALGLVDVQRMVQQALSELPAGPIIVELRDSSTNQVLFAQESASVGSTGRAAFPERASPLHVGDRTWIVAVRATPDFRSLPGGTGWVVLVLGLLITAGVARYIQGIRRRETEQSELVAQRRENAAHLKAIFDTSLDAIISANDHGVISEWNPSSERLFGWRPEEVIGKTLAETVIPLDDRAGHIAALAALRETGKSSLIGTAFEYVMVRRDGSPVPVELVMTPTPSGGRTRITAFIRDITRRKAAEAEMQVLLDDLENRVEQRTREFQKASVRLAESEDRLRLLFENAGDAVYLSDENGGIVEINRRACTMLGYERDELLAMTIADVEMKADRAQPVGPRLAGLEPGEIMTSQGEQRRKDGSLFPVEVRVGPVDEGGRRLYLAVARDVTERKAMEAVLAAARDQAIEASRLKSDFLANMSHEIRTPLNGILGMTWLLLDSELSPSQRDDLHIVHSSAEHLLALINDILDLARIEAGRFHVDSAPFDLENVLHGVAGLLSAAAERKQIEFILRVAPETPRSVLGDAPRLRQVLVNLAGNAVKFTESGHVLLEAEAVGRTDEGVAVRFAVADTGIGIPAEHLARVFEKFTQADQSTRRKYGGAGLGLAISRQIVEAMGGQIDVSSVEGKGSECTFTLTLPVVSEQAPSAWPSELYDVRALIVDDDPVNRRVLKEQLHAWRMRETDVATPGAALAELRAGAAAGDPYRVALLDFQMEEMDGLELAQRIRSAPDLDPPLVLLLSSVGRHFDHVTVHKAGIARWMTKPVSPSELLDALTDVWQGRGRRAQTRALAGAASSRPLHVLLAEDSAVNQQVAVRML